MSTLVSHQATSDVIGDPVRPARHGQSWQDLAITDDLPPAAWDGYVFGHPDATAYHGARWRRVFERAFGHECQYLAALRSGRVAGVLPLVAFRSLLFGRFAVSLPFVNYGGVLADDAAAAAAIEQRALSLARERRWRHVELRHFDQRFPQWPARRHKVTMELALPDTEDELWPLIDRKARNQVRKAERSNLHLAQGGAELLPEFYQVFARNMRDLGTPVYSRHFFDVILEALASDARVFVVRFGADAVAASVTVRWRDRIEVPWASSLREHNDKSPNNLLYMSMLRFAVCAGARVFDFGRSTPGGHTYRFKQQWGAEPRGLAWEYVGLSGALPDQGPTNSTFRMAIGAWQRLPLSVATMLGPHVVRHIP